MKKVFISIFIAALLFALNACEKVVTLKVKDGAALPYIDAWITDQPGIQTIRFLQAVNYLDTKEPAPIDGAQIRLTDLTSNIEYPFSYANGVYTYDAGNNRIGFIDHRYKLDILYKGIPFTALDTLKRNTVIDSMTAEHKDNDGSHKEGYYATFYAKDLPGGIDYYWVRTYKNGTLNYYSGEMFSIDGSFDANISDGFEFIPPFRDGITPDDHPYVKGDAVKVLIRSVSKPSYEFGNQLNNQLRNGGLFATILENVPGNVTNGQSGSNLAIYGWFGTVSETYKEKVME